jgi:hypothetical protein
MRSFTPIPLGFLVLVYCWRSHIFYGPGGEIVDAAFNILGPALCLIGSTLRFLIISSVPPKAVSEGRRFRSSSLETTQWYAWVRHPLYLGNIFICLGLLCVAHEPLAYALGCGFLTVHLTLTIGSEEAFLRTRFGAAFDAYQRATPLMFPRTLPKFKMRHPRLALQREINPLSIWLSCALGLWVWESFARGQLRREDARLAALGFGFAVGVAILNKLFKMGPLKNE